MPLARTKPRSRGKNAGQSLEYKLFTKCPHPAYVATQFIKVFFPLARIRAEKRIEMEEELLIKVGMLIIVFRLAENTKGETDFIRGEV